MLSNSAIKRFIFLLTPLMFRRPLDDGLIGADGKRAA
jgi:hypothetical protein